LQATPRAPLAHRQKLQQPSCELLYRSIAARVIF